MKFKPVRYDRKHPEVGIAEINRILNDLLKSDINILSRLTKLKPSDAKPRMDRAADAGTSIEYARGDHVHPSDTSKVDREPGKGLSTNDYTSDEKSKLSGIEAGANKTVASDSTPSMDGTASAGTSATYSRSDHVHPSDTSKVDTVIGKGLSTNDYDDTSKGKVDTLSFADGKITSSLLPTGSFASAASASLAGASTYVSPELANGLYLIIVAKYNSYSDAGTGMWILSVYHHTNNRCNIKELFAPTDGVTLTFDRTTYKVTLQNTTTSTYELIRIYKL